jgi:hypothetical protein
MKYFIQRELNEYGPYTLADLQRYVSQGSILLTDLTRSEGMTEWVPVSQVIGNIPAPAQVQPATPAAGGTVYGATGTMYDGSTAVTAYGGTQGAYAPDTALVPPDFHWALVLLIGFFCGIFQTIWLFVEAGFVKKLDPESKGIPLLIGGIATPIVGFFIFAASSAGYQPERDGFPVFAVPFFVLLVASVVFHLMAVFQMRSSIERYYNTVEPINLRLSGIMTFFFAVFYFQYHFTRIANWKRTGYLQPQ